MHELQQILLQKLPRLSKLIFGGRIRLVMEEPQGHNHILEALGEDWAMDGKYYLFNHVLKGRPDFPEPILLPRDLSNLSLPEYEKTRKQLIQLLTK